MKQNRAKTELSKVRQSDQLPAGSSCLDLPCAESHHEVGDEAVLRLARPVRYHGDDNHRDHDRDRDRDRDRDHDTSLALPVRHHGAPSLGLGHVVSLDRLGHRADLVHLEEQAVKSLLC